MPYFMLKFLLFIDTTIYSSVAQWSSQAKLDRLGSDRIRTRVERVCTMFMFYIA